MRATPMRAGAGDDDLMRAGAGDDALMRAGAGDDDLMRAGAGDDGFTLIEALVAMAVLAAGAVGLLTAVERHSALARGLGDRTIARWAAENRMTEIALGLGGTDTATETLLGIDWRVAATVTATNDPDLAQIEVTAGDAAARSDETLLRLTGFVDATTLGDELRP